HLTIHFGTGTARGSLRGGRRANRLPRLPLGAVTLQAIVEISAATVPAWLAVVLPILTLLIGAAVPILTQRLQSAEARKAREEIRADDRRDRQRAALLELQDALTEAQRILTATAADR